jgi:Ca2+/H+ antiporter
VNLSDRSIEPDETDEPASSKPHILLIVILGFVLPYLAIFLGWSLVPASIREHYDPKGEAAAGIVRTIVLFATLVGFVPGAMWFWSRRRPTYWRFAAGLVVVVQLICVFIFNFWYYLEVGGAFP